jgi:hypothetical protein
MRRCGYRLPIDPNTRNDSLAHLHAQSNAVGRFSVLPYSVRAKSGYPIARLVPWSEAQEVFEEPIRAGELDAYLKRSVRRDGGLGDYANQTFGDRAKAPARPFKVAAAGSPVPMAERNTRGPIITAALSVLQDGRAHSAEEILAVAQQRGLLDTATTKKYVYTALIEYIARTTGNGRKPVIVQDADRSFRINEPPDEWPTLPDAAPPALPAAIQAIVDRLDSTVTGPDAAAFEEAVCDAFDALGFASTHLGGQKAPDGYADALLGVLGYRTMIECKSGDEGVDDPSVFEASKFKDAYSAQFCALVGRAFSGELEVLKELHNHGVSAWTVEDLQTLLRIGSNPLEMRPLFAPGFAADALDDLLWERAHGRSKRVRLIADAIVRTGRSTQAAYRGVPSDAPRLTEDVAMVLVNQDLAAQGSTAACNRDDVRAACEYLANPLTQKVELDPGDKSIVVL